MIESALKQQIDKAFAPPFTITNGQVCRAQNEKGEQQFRNTLPILGIAGIHLHDSEIILSVWADPADLNNFFSTSVPGIRYKDLLDHLGKGERIEIELRPVDSAVYPHYETNVRYIPQSPLK
ncbi:MAG: hypothetical protein AAB546_00285 [Patescibacteria group bacterium]